MPKEHTPLMPTSDPLSPTTRSSRLAFDLPTGTKLGVGWLWLASLALGKAWPVDFIWSGYPPCLALALALQRCAGGGSLLQELPARQWVVLALVWGWGARLTYNFVARGGVGHEDWRYTAQREQFGRHFWLASLVTVFLAQSTFMFAGCLSLFPAMRQGVVSEGDEGVTLSVGVAVTLAAVGLEAAADRQLDQFVAARKSGDGGAVCDAGLWAWSRHPNYFGEWLFWLGLWLLGGGRVWSWASVGPLTMSMVRAFIHPSMHPCSGAACADVRS